MIVWKTHHYSKRIQTFALCLKYRNFSSAPSSYNAPLETPTIVYSDNHLLVVSKPAGWHSVPSSNSKQKKISPLDDDDDDQSNNNNNNNNTASSDAKNTNNNKCLLTYLKQMKHGGGSRYDFLLPLHRLDQPCTGVLMFGKTSKAASRIQQQWSNVKKTYLCVVLTSGLDRLYQASVPITSNINRHEHDVHSSLLQHDDDNDDDDEGYFELTGSFIQEHQHHQRNSSSSSSSSSNRRLHLKKTVEIRPFQENVGRPCRLEWKRIHLNSSHSDDNNKMEMNKIVLLKIKTNQGRRHMIRAMLSQVGRCPIAGDLRYHARGGGQQQQEDETTDLLVGAPAGPLPDQSVALHAHTLQLPISLQLGNQLPSGIRFTAPIPRLWKTLFSITDNDVPGTLLNEHD